MNFRVERGKKFINIIIWEFTHFLCAKNTPGGALRAKVFFFTLPLYATMSSIEFLLTLCKVILTANIFLCFLIYMTNLKIVNSSPCCLDPVCRYRYKPGGPGDGLCAGLQPHLRQRLQVRQVGPVQSYRSGFKIRKNQIWIQTFLKKKKWIRQNKKSESDFVQLCSIEKIRWLQLL